MCETIILTIQKNKKKRQENFSSLAREQTEFHFDLFNEVPNENDSIR